MFRWLRRKSDALKELSLPGDVGAVSVPADFITELKDDSTLLAYPEGSECITLRFSSISFTKNDGAENGGIEHVRLRSEEKNLLLQKYPEKAVVSYEQDSTEGGTSLLINYWVVGSKNTVVIVSATIVRDLSADRRVKRTLKLMPEIIRSVTITKLHRVVDDAGKRFEATVKNAAPVPQRIQGFSAIDEKWRIDNLATAKQLSAKYGIANAHSPDELDAVFSAWLHHSAPKESSDDVANALGAAFGEYLVSRNGFQWVMVTDEYGAEYAVRHDIGETMAFPRASVLQRIEDGKEGFLRGIYVIVCDQMKRAG
jgi:hypothetical protein